MSSFPVAPEPLHSSVLLLLLVGPEAEPPAEPVIPDTTVAVVWSPSAKLHPWSPPPLLESVEPVDGVVVAPATPPTVTEVVAVAFVLPSVDVFSFFFLRSLSFVRLIAGCGTGGMLLAWVEALPP
uniref:Secreted protein n=1 Tax=Anopheles darlingi TaxID=43151 RepID=A0A2M4DI32_ANODA